MMEVLTLAIPKDLDVLHPTFATPDLTTFCRLDELGLVAVGQLIEPDRATIECRVVEDDPWCRKCGVEGVPRDTVTRRLAHEPFGHRPTTLLVRVRRYRCGHCRRTWRQDMTRAAAPRAKISRGGLEWALRGIVIDHLTVTRVAAGLGVSWSAANAAVLTEGKRRLVDDPARFDGVTTIGVDEHVWRHTRFGDKYVTVIIDLTPARNKTGPARLLDMVEGRSKAVFKQWLAGRPKQWREADRGGRDGRLRRVQDRCRRGTPRRRPRHGPVPRGPPRRRRAGCLPASGPARHHRSPRAQGRPALQSPPHPAHRGEPAHRPAAGTPGRSVRERGARRGRGDLGHLPAHRRGLPGPTRRKRRR